MSVACEDVEFRDEGVRVSYRGTLRERHIIGLHRASGHDGPPGRFVLQARRERRSCWPCCALITKHVVTSLQGYHSEAGVDSACTLAITCSKYGFQVWDCCIHCIPIPYPVAKPSQDLCRLKYCTHVEQVLSIWPAGFEH